MKWIIIGKPDSKEKLFGETIYPLDEVKSIDIDFVDVTHPDVKSKYSKDHVIITILIGDKEISNKYETFNGGEMFSNDSFIQKEFDEVQKFLEHNEEDEE